jgi:hypothetical protein
LSDVTFLAYDNGDSARYGLTFPLASVFVGKFWLGKDFRWMFAVVFLILRHGWADTESSEQQDCTECKGNGRFHGWQYISTTAQRLINAVTGDVGFSAGPALPSTCQTFLAVCHDRKAIQRRSVFEVSISLG